MSKVIQEVQAFREKNRSSPLFNHLSAVSESVPALGWVAIVRRRVQTGTVSTECCSFCSCVLFLSDIKSIMGLYVREVYSNQSVSSFLSVRIFKHGIEVSDHITKKFYDVK